jgi:hypothetical protein
MHFASDPTWVQAVVGEIIPGPWSSGTSFPTHRYMAANGHRRLVEERGLNVEVGAGLFILPPVSPSDKVCGV